MSTLPTLGRILQRPRRALAARRSGVTLRESEAGWSNDRSGLMVRSTGSTASPTAAKSTPERFEPAFRLVREAVADGRLDAAGVAIRHGGGGAAVESMARPRGDRSSRDSIWFLASITKPVTAAAVMLLVEDGKLDLDRPLVEDLPEFAGRERAAVTPRHLLSHTAGIDDTATDELTRSRPSARQLFDLACRLPLRFPAGSRFEYSSVSFFLLGELIARSSGLPYAQFVHDRILAPLGMDETAFDPRPLGRHRLMPVHGAALDSWWKKRIALGYLAKLQHPGGGLWGTVDDVLRLGDAFLDSWHGRPGALLRPATIREMTQIQTAESPAVKDGVERPASYGLGWWKPGYARELPASKDAFEHGGASGTRILVDPAHDLVAVFLSNRWQQLADVACWPFLNEVYRALEGPDRASPR